jgi:hypothetical protein
MVFDKNLNFIRSFGSEAAVPSDPQEGELFGPERFVAILNKKITLIDEWGSDTADIYNRLVSFDADGSDWSVFTAGDAGKPPLKLFQDSGH